MKLIDQLMIEHRLLERMIALMKGEMDRIGECRAVDMPFLESAVVFMRSYTDVCHHGKEEQIYFAALKHKPLPPDLRQIMTDLAEEHVFARKTVDDIENARERYRNGEKAGLADVISSLNIITIFYAEHMRKEEHYFFGPSLEYLSPEEQDQLLRAFAEYDSGLYHADHRRIVEGLERRKSGQKGGAPSGARA